MDREEGTVRSLTYWDKCRIKKHNEEARRNKFRKQATEESKGKYTEILKIREEEARIK